MKSNTRLGPFRSAEPYGEPGVIREFECSRYEDCLLIAAKPNWPSFTCTGCSKSSSVVEKVVEEKKVVQKMVARVPLEVFVQRVVNDPFGQGYSAGNFLRKMHDDVKNYYGDDSLEFSFIRVRLILLNEILGGAKKDLFGVKMIAKMFDGEFNGVPNLHEVYLTVCGSTWRVQL